MAQHRIVAAGLEGVSFGDYFSSQNHPAFAQRVGLFTPTGMREAPSRTARNTHKMARTRRAASNTSKQAGTFSAPSRPRPSLSCSSLSHMCAGGPRKDTPAVSSRATVLLCRLPQETFQGHFPEHTTATGMLMLFSGQGGCE